MKNAARKKIFHYKRLYAYLPDPIVFMPVAVNTSGRSYDDFLRLIFLHAHREASVLAGELSEESDQFHFLRAVCLDHLKGSVAVILAKGSATRVVIPLDLSTRSFICCRYVSLDSFALVALPLFLLLP